MDIPVRGMPVKTFHYVAGGHCGEVGVRAVLLAGQEESWYLVVKVANIRDPHITGSKVHLRTEPPHEDMIISNSRAHEVKRLKGP